MLAGYVDTRWDWSFTNLFIWSCVWTCQQLLHRLKYRKRPDSCGTPTILSLTIVECSPDLYLLNVDDYEVPLGSRILLRWLAMPTASIAAPLILLLKSNKHIYLALHVSIFELAASQVSLAELSWRIQQSKPPQKPGARSSSEVQNTTMPKVLLTGANGFLATHVLQRLVDVRVQNDSNRHRLDADSPPGLFRRGWNRAHRS